MINNISIREIYDNTPIKGDMLLIPEWIFDQLHTITYNQRESVGYMITRKESIDDMWIGHIVEGVLLSNVGTKGHVTQTRSITIKDNPDIIPIEFHTHVEALGPKWFGQFSSEDFDTFRERLKEDADYQHTLFTPTSVLTFSKTNPLCPRVVKGEEEIVINKFYEWKEKLAYWEKQLQKNNNG